MASRLADSRRLHLLSLLAGMMSVTLPLADQRAAAQKIIAHRGASHEGPENTLAAFELAWQRGADGIEGDFHLTADGHIVCIHDKTTGRTAGVDLPVATSTLAQLRQLDVGAWKAPRFAGQRIPTLPEVMATVPPDKTLLIEVKCGPEIVPALKNALAPPHTSPPTGRTTQRNEERKGPPGGWRRSAAEPPAARPPLDPRQIVVIAFDRQVVAAVKRELPHIRAYWLVSYQRDDPADPWSPAPREVLDTLRATGADGLDTQANPAVVTAEFVRELRAAGQEFHVWTVDDPAVARRFQRLGVDSITTNRPACVRAGLLTAGLPKHLQVHLALDGHVADRSGHRRTAGFVTRPPAAAAFVAGVFGQAADLGGAGSAVAVDYTLPAAGSICLWYRTVPWYNYQTIFDNQRDANCWEMWLDRDAVLRFRDQARGTAVPFRLHPTGDVHEWQHLAVTWDCSDQTGEAVCLYVNGRLAGAAPWHNRSHLEPGATFFLGGGHSGNSRGRGVWDDVGLFDTVLRPADVRAIMMEGVAVACEPFLKPDAGP